MRALGICFIATMLIGCTTEAPLRSPAPATTPVTTATADASATAAPAETAALNATPTSAPTAQPSAAPSAQPEASATASAAPPGSSASPAPADGPLVQAGRLAPADIQGVVRASFKKLTPCYEKGLKKDPKLAGKIVVKFSIGKDGKVTKAESTDKTFPDPNVVTCVVDAFKRLTFPKADAPTTVSYPVVFSPS